jgi:propanol-preferring alcohol dehydrogenase
MIAARLHEYGKPLVVEDIPIPDIQADEILVKVAACGVCRTDAELIDGYFKPYFNIRRR